MEELRECPFCAEEVKQEALKCKHCGESLEKSNQSKSNTSIPEDVLINLTFWKLGNIKNPKQYGGWGRFVRLVTIIPVVGILVGMLGLTSTSVVKNAQGKAMIIWNIFWTIILLSVVFMQNNPDLMNQLEQEWNNEF